MILAPVNVNLANSKYAYMRNDGNQFCWWYADIYDIRAKKVDIMYDLLNKINEWNTGLIYKEWLIAIFNQHELNNEDYNYFEIFDYVDWYSENDYRKSWNKTYGFWFISNRVV